MSDEDFFGICRKCSDRIVGPASGCAAMGEIYHVSCFCCAVCEQPLKGRQFYAIDELPYCEDDYLQTLDKCSACRKPIVERILTANSASYHPECFTCFVCNKILDNVPFTVAPNGKVHCIDDYHEKYAPRCSVCELPIVPVAGERETVRIVALERNFHVHCYKCEDCNLKLASKSQQQQQNQKQKSEEEEEEEKDKDKDDVTNNQDAGGCYPLDGRILCRECNRARQLAARNQSK